MLPPSVHSQYVRYKENTTSFVNWLFGQAKKVMKAGSLPSQSADLSSQHLLPMAQACKKASIIMPAMQRSFLERAVSLRRKVGAHYVAGGSAATSDADDSHRFFTDCLQRILDLFPAPTPVARPATDSAPIPDMDESFINQFSVLDVEGHDDIHPESLVNEPADECPSPPPTQRPAARVSNQLLDLVDDPRIELWCLLIEIRDIRRYVKSIWSEYVAGKVDLVTASLVTEAAFESMEIMNENFCQQHSHLNGLRQMIGCITSGWKSKWPPHLVDIRLLREGFFVEAKDSNGRRYMLRLDNTPFIDEVMDLMLAPEYNMLLELARDDTSHPCSKRRSACDLDYQRLRRLEAGSMCHEQFGHVWRADRLMRSLGHGQREKRIHLNVAAMVNVYLDLMRMPGLLKMVEEDYDRFAKRYPQDYYGIDTGDSEYQMWNKRNLVKFLAWMDPDNNFEGKEYFKINPMFAGLTVFFCWERTLNALVQTVTNGWALMPMAHAYNYGRVVGTKVGKWDDMETIITMQGQEIFTSQRPTDGPQCETRYWLAMGGKPGHITQLRKQKAFIYDEMKALSFPRPIASCKELRDGNPIENDRMIRFLARRNKLGYRRELHPTPILFGVFVNNDLALKRFTINDGILPPKVEKHVKSCLEDLGKPAQQKLSVPQFLDGLLAVAWCEIPNIFFNYFDFNRSCLDAHVALHYKVTDDIPHKYDDLDKIDLFYNDALRESMVKMAAESGDVHHPTHFAEDWRKFCRLVRSLEMRIFPRTEYGWEEKYKAAIKGRMSDWFK
ncbi:hypothetical protein COL154_008217 [Colletotrichum chrysophilum]|uniref:uncharacterized protein n=1 Tax=Colletotrichum chrysophilum TaxID=1836956 RepID=UPI002300BAFB|nr:uncharacterized protein COL26b_010639 [Colletotrichum chrysophilum]KAJ0347056.1 hypothetical protein KNSL1_006886 [Colletotrichum chrysophilum]KAJ0359579.1 hypothetical protein COL154_008217 [Colletotrichum chrysophilum]KAJ0369047.1 hypothetical protein COL26b_010639 [Colletotrichum chrysophilum]